MNRTSLRKTTTAPVLEPGITTSLPEFLRLPKAGKKCAVTGLSRSALNELILGPKPRVRSVCLRREGIKLPDGANECWTWTKGFSGRPKPRPVVSSGSLQILAYRVIYALIHQKSLRELKLIRHLCPIIENCWCVNYEHLAEGDDTQNAQDRSRYGTLHGDKNGSRTKPESRPRGRNDPKSKYRGKRGLRLIQTLRATYDSFDDKEGVLAALSRWTAERGNRISSFSIGRLVRRELHNDVPDDPSAALDPSQLHVQKRCESAKKRKSWPSGDLHKETRMPMAAKRKFVQLFHRTKKRVEKRKLVEYCAARYGVAYSTVQSVGYVDPASFGALSKAEIQQQEPVLQITASLLEEKFGGIPPFRERGQK